MAMASDCVVAVDVAVIGGGFAASSLALLLRREHPELRVLIIERTEKFDRKVGEATTEVSGGFLHRRLGLTSYLAHHQLPKQGLRLWFAGPETPFDECVELGANHLVRLPAFQIDREKLDTHLLETAVSEGAELWRPAKVSAVAFADGKAGDSAQGATLTVAMDGGERVVRARWVVDASGRAAMLARKLGHFRQLAEHPTRAIWGRFSGVTDWDGLELRSKHPRYGSSCIASRSAATNHLTGYGWWCWVIPLKGGDFSAGLVYDSRLYTPPAGDRLGERLKAHLMTHPIGREIFRDAKPMENDVRAYSDLPYFSERLAGPGWQLVGDAAGFLDPLYSPGLDYCSWTARCAFARISREHRGMEMDLEKLNERFSRSYHTWFRALYKDKYYYMGDAELMAAAYWLDISLFYCGPVRETTVAHEDDLDCLPFNGPVDGLAGRFMTFYNRRLSKLAQRRLAAGCYGRHNAGWRELGEGFTTNFEIWKPLMRGVWKWLAAEVHGFFLRPPRRATPANGTVPAPEPAR
jgi:flavin-dependent dehydrogenase